MSLIVKNLSGLIDQFFSFSTATPRQPPVLARWKRPALRLVAMADWLEKFALESGPTTDYDNRLPFDGFAMGSSI